MFTRRDALKTSLASALVPAAGIAAASTPATAGPGSGDTIRMRFPVGYDQNDGDRRYYFIIVEIMPLDAWRALDRPINGELGDSDCPDDDKWSAKLLEDGRVMGVRMEATDGEELYLHKHWPRDFPDPDAAAALRRVRRKFAEVLEDDPETDYLTTDFHGNGACTLTVGGFEDGLEIEFRCKH